MLCKIRQILLRSRCDAFPDGLANRSGVLGRYIMDHVKFFLMGRIPTKINPHAKGFETAGSSQYHDHQDRSLYSGARLLIRDNSGPTPLEGALASGKWGKDLKEEIKDVFGSYLTLGMIMEQLPQYENRITLSPKLKNEYGDPAPHIQFNLMSDYERRGHQELTAVLMRVFDALGAKDVRTLLKPAVSGHHIGGQSYGHRSR